MLNKDEEELIEIHEQLKLQWKRIAEDDFTDKNE